MSRAAWVLGFSVGWDEALFQAATDDLHEKVYLLGLSVLTEAIGLLTLGLVKPWDEVVPRWIPIIGGRRVPPLAAVIPAALGAVCLIVMWTPAPLMFVLPPQAGAPDGNGWELLMAACYLPLML